MAKKPLWSTTKEQLAGVPPVLSKNLAGKTVVIVGANTGIGLECARHFANMGPARLVLGCRDKAKGQAALNDIGYEKAELRLIDCASFRSVREFAQTFDGDEQGIDVLVLNAGVIMMNGTEWSEDGWEQAVQVNNLSPFYLSFLLLPVLQRASTRSSSSSRLVITSSEAHYWYDFDEEILGAPSIYGKLNEKEYCSHIHKESITV